MCKPTGARYLLTILAVLLPLCVALGSGQKPRKAAPKFEPCLPADVRLNDVATYGVNGKRNVSVGQTLTKLNAKCRGQRLANAHNQEIRFFKKTCWGYPPPNFGDLQEAERQDLKKLEAKYMVIVIPCDPRIP